MSVLAKEVLEEVPGQLLSYMKSRNLVPNPPRPGKIALLFLRSGLLFAYTRLRSATDAATCSVQCVRHGVSGEHAGFIKTRRQREGERAFVYVCKC